MTASLEASCADSKIDARVRIIVDYWCPVGFRRSRVSHRNRGWFASPTLCNGISLMKIINLIKSQSVINYPSPEGIGGLQFSVKPSSLLLSFF